MDRVEKYQQQLLEQSQYIYYRTPISYPTVQAYLATPRHMFVKRYREWGTTEWHEVHAENVAEYVATLYTDKPLILFGDNDDNISSTISQPSFVLRMLDLLQLQPGQQVFELGAGSGWNAALMGHLVGPKGHVYSLEIIPEVATSAARRLRHWRSRTCTSSLPMAVKGMRQGHRMTVRSLRPGPTICRITSMNR